jgi:hypothetical protein
MPAIMNGKFAAKLAGESKALATLLQFSHCLSTDVNRGGIVAGAKGDDVSRANGRSP